MATKIQMGNDEFILYIRKTSDCTISTQQLGRLIWEWLRLQGAIKLYDGIPQPCYWGDHGTGIGPQQLPYHSTQFEFDRSLLPQLYSFLDQLALSVN